MSDNLQQELEDARYDIRAWQEDYFRIADELFDFKSEKADQFARINELLDMIEQFLDCGSISAALGVLVKIRGVLDE